MTTTISTALSRGTSSRRRRSSRNRMLRPSAISIVNSKMPQTSFVSRNASAISTGMNVPNASIPTILRITTITSAPIGIISSTAYTACVWIGRL